MFTHRVIDDGKLKPVMEIGRNEEQNKPDTSHDPTQLKRHNSNNDAAL